MVTGAGGVLGRATAATLARPATEPTAGTAAYSVTKAALVHLTRVVDAELRPSGIRVNGSHRSCRT